MVVDAGSVAQDVVWDAGGESKMVGGVNRLGGKKRRMGTYDVDLKRMGD